LRLHAHSSVCSLRTSHRLLSFPTLFLHPARRFFLSQPVPPPFTIGTVHEPTNRVVTHANASVAGGIAASWSSQHRLAGRARGGMVHRGTAAGRNEDRSPLRRSLAAGRAGVSLHLANLSQV